MAGPQDIQRYPRGLIDLLGMRATGDTPHQLAQTTVAQLELLDFYLTDRCEGVTFNASGVVAALGNLTFTGAQVPQGQMWMLYEASVFTGVCAAATSATVVPFIARSQSGLAIAEAICPPLVAGIAGSALGGAHYIRPTLLMPGHQFGLQITAITGAPGITPILNLYFARLQV